MVNGTARANIQIGIKKRIRNIFPLKPSLPNLDLDTFSSLISGGDGFGVFNFGLETVMT